MNATFAITEDTTAIRYEMATRDFPVPSDQEEDEEDSEEEISFIN